MKRTNIILTALTVSFFSYHALSDTIAVAEDGRQVVLADNGSWKYVSKDRFAITEKGFRVRLKGDGQWEPTDNLPVKKAEQIVTSRVDVSVKSVTVESYRKKLLKGTISSSQTVIDMSLTLAESSAALTPTLNDFNLFKVSDDKNKQYSIVSITPSEALVEPGGSLTFSVRVKDSPTGLLAVGTQQLLLHIDAEVFGTPTDLQFSSLIDDAKAIRQDRPF